MSDGMWVRVSYLGFLPSEVDLLKQPTKLPEIATQLAAPFNFTHVDQIVAEPVEGV